MKNIFEHIEHAKGKPHHVRKQIAFGAAGGATALIALVWFVQSISSSSFAIKGASFAESSGQQSVIVTDGENRNQNVAGAAAAFQGSSASAYIEVVDVASSTQKMRQVEQTILPF